MSSSSSWLKCNSFFFLQNPWPSIVEGSVLSYISPLLWTTILPFAPDVICIPSRFSSLNHTYILQILSLWHFYRNPFYLRYCLEYAAICFSLSLIKAVLSCICQFGKTLAEIILWTVLVWLFHSSVGIPPLAISVVMYLSITKASNIRLTFQ